MYILKRKNRNISVKTIIEVNGKEQIVEISCSTRDETLARERAPKLIEEATRHLMSPEVYCTLTELREFYFMCPLLKLNYETRKHNWNELVHLIKALDLDTEMPINELGLLKEGKSIIRQYEDKFGNPHKLRKIRSIFQKKFIYWLEVEKGITTSCFSHILAYSPRQAVTKPFVVSDDQIMDIYDKGKKLKDRHPEFFKMFLLASSGGLRRAEVLSLTWGDIHSFSGRNYIVLRETKAGHEQRVNIPASTYDALLSMKNGHSPADFVIDSPNRPKLWDREFVPFLRDKLGIHDNKPAHFLRKCLGAMLATRHGIYVASKTLRHASVTTTEKHYADLVSPANDIEIL